MYELILNNENNDVNYSNFRLSNYKERSPYDSNCIEFWAPIGDNAIPGVIPNRYWISTFGRIWNNNRMNFMSYSMHKKGYWQIALPTVDGNRITRKIHRIVMTTFCYFPGFENYEVNHMDGNKQNNFILNLEWCTHSENTIHAINMGLKTVFGHDYKVTLTNDQVKEIYKLIDHGYKGWQIREMLNISPEVSNELINNMVLGFTRKPDSMLD